LGFGRSTIRARVQGYWDDDGPVREVFNWHTPRGDYRWRELALTLDDDPDVFVVVGHPRFTDIDPGRTIVFECEPLPTRTRHRRLLAHPREAFLAYYDVERHHSVNNWQVGFRDVEASPEKSRVISAVVSSLSWLPRHAARLSFASRYLSAVPGFDHFGRGELSGPYYRGPIAAKADALLPYRYTFNSENWLEPNYFTEKILDAILCETLSFYDGCPNLELFLDPATFIAIDLRRPEEALAIVTEAIERDEWSSRIDAIRAQKKRLLEDLNPLEIVRKVVVGEPIVWRPERPSMDRLVSVTGASLHCVDGDDSSERSRVLAQIAAGDELGIVFDSRIQLVETAPPALEALVSGVRAGDLVLLGGVGISSFGHVGAHALPGPHELRHTVATGEEIPCAYAATPEAARALVRSGGRPHSIPMRAVWPPLAYLPGPLMRRDGHAGDAPLLGAPRQSQLNRIADSLVPSLPRGRRFAKVAIEAVSLAGLPVRRFRTRHRRAYISGGKSRTDALFRMRRKR
jgi:hypothetical protein